MNLCDQQLYQPPITEPTPLGELCAAMDDVLFILSRMWPGEWPVLSKAARHVEMARRMMQEQR